MTATINGVKDGESTLHAVKQFGVPQQTFGDIVSDKVVHGKNVRPKPLLKFCYHYMYSMFSMTMTSVNDPKFMQVQKLPIIT